MNKFRKLLIAILFAALTFCFATACAGGNKSNAVKNKFVVYGNDVITVSGSAGKDIKFPEDPLRNGYIFDGWYTDEAYTGSAVTSGKYDGKTVYYAKWAVACKIEFDADGGVLPVENIFVKEGSTVLTAVADYTPSKGDLQFGGWFIGDNALTDDIVATEAGLTLTAKYKAAFTINATLEALEGAPEVKSGYVNGYAFVGDNLEDYAAVHGFTADNADEFTISDDSSKNVFNVSYSRNRYNYTVYEYYPDGSHSYLAQKKYYFGTDVPVPTEKLSYDGYLFVGWATRNDASYDEALTVDTLKVDGDVSLYPVWDRGYADMFGGGDYIFVDHEDPNKVILRRGGVDIPGVYDEDYELYFFKNEDESFTLKVKLDEETHRFIFYALRGGVYYLLSGGEVNDKVYIDLDDSNRIIYGSREEGSVWVYEGTYEITADGLYTATLKNAVTEEETTLTFILRQNSLTGEIVFSVRGDEYLYGTMARKLNYYPLITLNGFGTATIATNTQSTTYSYTIDGDLVTLTSTSETVTIKIKDYDGVKGYDIYTAALDKVFYCESPAKLNATLTLDGCEGVTYAYGNETYTGTYTASASLLGGYVITVKAATADITKTYVYRTYDKKINNVNVAKMFVECGEDYKESYFVAEDGSIKNTQVLVTENGKAKFYEVKDSTTGFAIASEGTLVKNDDGSYTFTATKVEEWAAVNSTERVFGEYNTGNYNVYYFIEEDGVKAASTTDYVVEGGATLTLVSAFGIYTAKDGTTVSGLASIQSTYIVVTDGKNNYYFGKGEGDTLTLLDNAPMVLVKRYTENGTAKTDSNYRVTLTGKKTGDDYDAVYSVTTNGETAFHAGLATPERLVYPGGLTVEMYTFTSNDKAYSFRFFITQSTSNYGTVYYYNYYALDETIVLAEIQAIDDGDLDKDDVTLKFIYENGKTALEYSDGTNTYKGSFDVTSEKAQDGTESLVAGHNVEAFGKDDYTVRAYNFVSADGEHDFTFTIFNSRFRISAENAVYTGEGREKLELDGATHIARYTDKNGKQTYAYYLVTDGVLETDGKAIATSVNETTVIFDVRSDMTMERRGDEAGNYLVVDNGSLNGTVVRFDGHGTATIVHTGDERTEETAEYTLVDGLVTVKNGDMVVYIGKFGVYTENGTDYNALRLDVNGVVGAYLDETDLSVIVLDEAGNAVRYSSYGVQEVGYYYMIDTGVFYYENKALTAGYMYVVDGKVVRSSGFSASYYASDFASVVFYTNGIVRYNNNRNADKFYTYDEKTNTGKVYTKVESGDKNAYGYSYEEFSFSKNAAGEYETFTYNDGKKERTYYYFDGKYVTFNDEANNSTLEFQPTGAPTFSVIGTVTTVTTETTTDKDGKETTTEKKTTVQYYVVLTYDADGEPYIYLGGYYNNRSVNGGMVGGNYSGYTFTAQYDLEIDYHAKTFSFTPNTFKRSIVAYNYTYLLYMSYGYTVADAYGALQITENIDETNGSTYTVAGAFRYFPELDENGKAVVKKGEDGKETPVYRNFSFTDGKLSKAGNYNSRYGHAYTVEFTVDGELYLMKFYLMPANTFSSRSGGEIYAYVIEYVAKVTKAVTIDAEKNTIFYEQQLIFVGSRIEKGRNDKGETTYYEVGDAFNPALRIDGDIVNAYYTGYENGEWHFGSGVYSTTRYADYHYYFTPTLDENNDVIGGTLVKTRCVRLATPDGDEVYFLIDENNDVREVLSITFKGATETTAVTEGKKTADGVFEVVVGDKTYVVTFTKTVDEESGETKVSVAMAEKTAEAENAA